MFYERIDKSKLINRVSYHIVNIDSDIKNNGKNSNQFDVEDDTYNDARYIRKELQLNNENLYYLYIYITLYSDKKEEIEYLLDKLESLLNTSGLNSRRAYFREEQAFKSTLPFMINSNEIKEVAKRNMIEKDLASTYPFVTTTIFDEKGIFIGKDLNNNSLIFIDKFNKNKYKNSNMCIFGTSGAGKSYFTKINILRNALLDINQYIIDPEREYGTLCKNIGGTLIKIGPNSESYINIFDIRENKEDKETSGYLGNKINRLMGFFNLVFGNINEEEKALIEEKIIILYRNKDITFDNDSLYKNKVSGRKVFKEKEDMPLLEEFYEILKRDEDTKKLATKLIPFIKGSLNFFNNYTNIDINDSLIVADIYDLENDNIKFGMFLFIDLFWDLIRNDRSTFKSIYMDEIWRLVGVTSNKYVASFIYTIFKTIRKYNGSAVGITQDVSDLFSLDNGNFGKSIINNSCFKCFFSLEEENINVLKYYTNITSEEMISIKNLKRGECLMYIDKDHILAKIEVSEDESNII